MSPVRVTVDIEPDRKHVDVIGLTGADWFLNLLPPTYFEDAIARRLAAELKMSCLLGDPLLTFTTPRGKAVYEAVLRGDGRIRATLYMPWLRRKDPRPPKP